MSSFIDSGGEDGSDICNIFDFNEDDDVVGRMQSEWDEDTSTTTKKRKFKTAYQLSPVTVEKKNRFC